MIERLKAKNYESAAEVLDALSRLRGDSWNGIDHPDLLTGSAVRTTIRPPADLVGIDGRVRLLIDHPLFQRLRKVPQLDLLGQLLPGRVDTRFTHSLHTLELARGAIFHMGSEASIKIDLNPVLSDMFLFRALLTNIGHYQLLHVFEDFLEDRKRDPTIAKLNLLSNEEMFRQVVGVPAGGITLTDHPWTALIDEYGQTFPELVRDLLGDEWIAQQRPRTAPYSAIEALLVGLISSTIDITKLAYLIDDSQMIGLRSGRAIDTDEIFASLVRPLPEDLDGGPVVAVRERAVPYLESAVFARYWLIQKGYCNKKNRALQAMVKFVIATLIKAGRFDFAAYLRDTAHADTPTAMGYLAKQFENARKEGVIDQDVRNPISDALLSSRVIYDRVLTLSPRSQTPARRGDESIYVELSGKTALDLNDVAKDIRMMMADELHVSTRPGDILVDLPRRRPEGSSGRVVVYSNDRRERLGDLYQASPEVAYTKDSFALFARRLRVFIHPECLRSSTAEKAVIRDRMLGHLREKYGPDR
jgi:HD superfamily phosphohydrolase